MHILHSPCKYSKHTIIERDEAHNQYTDDSFKLIQTILAKHTIFVLIVKFLAFSILLRRSHHDDSHETCKYPNKFNLKEALFIDDESKKHDPKCLRILNNCKHAQRQKRNRENVKSLANSHHEWSVTQSKSVLMRHTLRNALAAKIDKTASWKEIQSNSW